MGRRWERDPDAVRSYRIARVLRVRPVRTSPNGRRNGTDPPSHRGDRYETIFRLARRLAGNTSDEQKKRTITITDELQTTLLSIYPLPLFPFARLSRGTDVREPERLQGGPPWDVPDIPGARLLTNRTSRRPLCARHCFGRRTGPKMFFF